METLHTDYLIIGSGLAGSTYAYEVLKLGHECIMISGQKDLGEANSHYAQGGIIFDKDPGPPGDLFQDIMDASDDEANPEAIATLVEMGPKILEEVLLSEIHVNFDRDEKENLKFTREAAHSKSRIIFSKDITGEVILKAMHETLSLYKKKGKLRAMTDSTAVDLLTLSHSSKNSRDRFLPLTCVGAYVFDSKEKKVKAIVAKKTVLATGGLGQLFLNTTNSDGAYGHGIAMAQRIGARVMDMEYIQFHPTAFYQKGKSRSFLISEALRGEGGVLINSKGESFMERYHPLKSLAPRDIIARSINFEMIKTHSPCVYLDLSALGADYIKTRFPSIYAQCLESKIDITVDPIPVSPAAHYLCGGVSATMEGVTNIRNLKAIGESACTGLHGANRLASTSLLECLVMGYLGAQRDIEEVRTESFLLPEIKEWEMPQELPDEALIQQDLSLIKNTMWNYVGLVRSEKRLHRAEKILHELEVEIEEFYSNCTLTNDLLNLRSAIKTSLLVVHASLYNKRSRGCHYRED